MSSNKMATKSDLQEMYSRILPYLGGSADAGFTPIGTIIAVFSETAPANYLICDGSTYNKSDYPELAAHLLALTTHSQYEVSGDSTKFKVPDLRGEFLRGTGTNGHTNQGNGANVGVHQDGTEHTNTFEYNQDIGIYLDGNTSAFNAKMLKQDSVVKPEAYYATVVSKAINAQTGYAATYTSRPTNTSVLFCIATKNIYLNPQNDYSTDEKVIGTWIDSRPIYQRTIVLDNPTDMVQLLQNVDSLVDSQIIWFQASGNSNTACFYINSEDYYMGRVQLKASDNTLQYRQTKATNLVIARVQITIQYTKTTS